MKNIRRIKKYVINFEIYYKKKGGIHFAFNNKRTRKINDYSCS